VIEPRSRSDSEPRGFLSKAETDFEPLSKDNA
jgi:hypothetical protein